MDARYKISFSGEFKEWVEMEEFIHAFSRHLNVSEVKAATLFDVERKVNLKKNLTEHEAERHMAAFQKMGMLVSKKLMMKPLVGPLIERESRIVDEVKVEEVESHTSVILQGKKRISSIASSLKSLVNRGGA